MALDEIGKTALALALSMLTGTVLWRLFVSVVIFIGVPWSLGWIGIMGTEGFARAETEKSVHALAAIQMLDLSKQVTDVSGALKLEALERARSEAQRAENDRQAGRVRLRQQIYQNERDRCNSKSQEARNLLLDQANDLRGEYKRVTGEEYPPSPGCAAYQ